MRGLIIFLICLGAALCFAPCTFAQPPEIEIDLSFDQSSYGYGEPVGAEVVVTNEGAEILINDGFSDRELLAGVIIYISLESIKIVC